MCVYFIIVIITGEIVGHGCGGGAASAAATIGLDTAGPTGGGPINCEKLYTARESDTPPDVVSRLGG